MDDNSINKYLELMSKVKYDSNDNEKLFVSITKLLNNEDNIQIEKLNSMNTTSMIGADIYPKRHSLIASITTAAILFVLLLVILFPDTITSLYERFIGVSPTPASQTTPNFQTNYTATPIFTPKKTPFQTEQQTPSPTVRNVYIRDLTKNEEILNNIYHTIFPDRTDYIAYWMDDNIFWAPAHLQETINIGDYQLYKIKYRYELLPNENSKILFFEEQVVDQLHYRHLYCIRINSTTGEVISKRYDISYLEDSLSYRIISINGVTYLALATNTWEHGELYFSEIVNCETMEPVWNIQDLYPDNWESYKVVLNENGIDLYHGERLDTYLVNFELVRRIPYDELIYA